MISPLASVLRCASVGKRIPSVRVIRARLLSTTTTESSGPHALLRPLLSTKAEAQDEATKQLEGVMSLVLNRPETRNALSVRMVGEMREALAKFNSMPFSSARILLLHSSTPGQFCSGADLRERRSMSPTQVGQFLDSLRALVCELEGIKGPSIAVVDGNAFGGGAELALGCDLRVGGQHTKISLPETKLGIIPGAGGTQRLSHLIGSSKAKELIFTGRAVDGMEAYRLGLINQLATATATASPPTSEALSSSQTGTELKHTTNTQALIPTPSHASTSTGIPHLDTSAFSLSLILARQILSSAPLALSAAKASIDASSRLGLEEGLDFERRAYDGLLGTRDRGEGLMAFKEKRRAVFEGR